MSNGATCERKNSNGGRFFSFSSFFRSRVGIGQDLQPLFFGRRELGPCRPGRLEREPASQEHDQGTCEFDERSASQVGRFLFSSNSGRTRRSANSFVGSHECSRLAD